MTSVLVKGEICTQNKHTQTDVDVTTQWEYVYRLKITWNSQKLGYRLGVNCCPSLCEGTNPSDTLISDSALQNQSIERRHLWFWGTRSVVMNDWHVWMFIAVTLKSIRLTRLRNCCGSKGSRVAPAEPSREPHGHVIRSYFCFSTRAHQWKCVRMRSGLALPQGMGWTP